MAMLCDLANSKGFLCKGPHTALRRWFSWVGSAKWHDSCWHARLLSMVYLGIRMGVYRTHWECPFWTSGESKATLAQEEHSDEEVAEEKAAAAAVPGQASSSNQPAQPGPVAHPEGRRGGGQPWQEGAAT
eukprot:1128287-Lingulodinium_polyedra.AAC.1